MFYLLFLWKRFVDFVQSFGMYKWACEVDGCGFIARSTDLVVLDRIKDVHLDHFHSPGV